MFTLYEMFTVLKGLEMFSSTVMSVRSTLLLGSLMYYGVTVRSSVLKLYWVTYDIASAVRTLEARSSAPSSVSFS